MKKTSGSVAVIVSLAVVLISSLSAACAPGSLVLPAATPPPAVPTATVDPTPIPTIDAQGIEDAKSNQNIQDFLNKSGIYTDEAMSNRLMTYQDQRIALGWIGEGDTTVDFQGEFLGYIVNDEYILMAVGFCGTDGLNHVKPIAIPIGFFSNSDGQSDKFPFQFRKLGGWSLLTSHKLQYETSLKGVEERLNTIKGTPVILSFSTGISDEDISNKGVGRFGEVSRSYYEELQKNSPLFTGLMSEVVVKSNEDIVLQKTKYSLSSDVKIPDIKNIEDLTNIDLSVIPRAFAISSNLW
ncbi:MAG: hypothetical protein VB068_00725 [Petrimonas sp.]|nr:hypothetical protein [Petrimonas sp.]